MPDVTIATVVSIYPVVILYRIHLFYGAVRLFCPAVIWSATCRCSQVLPTPFLAFSLFVFDTNYMYVLVTSYAGLLVQVHI